MRKKQQRQLWWSCCLVLLVGTLGAALLLARNGIGNGKPQRRACITVGLASPSLPYASDDITNFIAANRGRKPDILLWYNDFKQYPDIDALRKVDTSITPLITWEPFDSAVSGLDQPDFRLQRIASGKLDDYLRRWAVDLRDLKRTVILRFAHEANGNWYPWSEQNNGNNPGDYQKAYRHVWKIFHDNHAANVQWMWSPNVLYAGSTPLKQLYPGDGVVDLVGIDGYNWGNTRDDKQWQSPASVFGATVAEVESITKKPLMISEVGSAESGGNKAQWIKEFGSYLQNNLQIKGYIWFDYNKETDWRVTSSIASAVAYADLINQLPTVNCLKFPDVS